MIFVIFCSGIRSPIEKEDGYQSVSREAAQSLQASGPEAEPNYVIVDRSKKNRRPPTLAYAQVEISEMTPKKVMIMKKYCQLQQKLTVQGPLPGNNKIHPVISFPPPGYKPPSAG